MEKESPINNILSLQKDYSYSKSVKERKATGQYFTGSVIAKYMASLVNIPNKKCIRILDAGAGLGILTASASLYCLEKGCESVHAVLYEIDKDIFDKIKISMDSIYNEFRENGKKFSYEIISEDFILSRPDKNKDIEPFDISVINPPYFKYNLKTSPYARAVADLYDGDPNIYASFMAVVVNCMNVNGQLITITPRSFTNGLYFKGLRGFLLSKVSLSLIHIFRHRNKIFQNDENKVLQENIICSFVKRNQSNKITIRSSDCDLKIESAEERQYSSSTIIYTANNLKLIRIPENDQEAAILKIAESLPNTFSKAGYFISTGKVVEHRTKDFIISPKVEANSVPLYRPHNITPMKISWDGNHKKDVSFILNKNHEKHTIINSNYVILKRFSSKDEKRRLVASIHLQTDKNYKYIGFGNKTNYIGLIGETLSQTEAFGVSALFNSTFMDKYFRCISGNTQVNATEVRVMMFPSRKQIQQIGGQIEKSQIDNQKELDEIVNSILAINF
ncbi:methyltransferase [Flavobacterium arcticum]|uniref:site-specific DNA-methyltransferase (adenine-specific) n=1 Tax=Flavobacterium arcticum TaxID=1784713 RepID=A0A345HFF5_9FLAO|nr:methyltransferase [Flavobacterium arcticum]KAF2511193.1 methyltransferase [Flavobacterium arcticum]